MKFSQRSQEKELLDRDDIPFADIKKNMEELNVINTWLGGHKITIQGLKRIAGNRATTKQPLLILEIGCGGGDNLRAIKNWARKKKLAFELLGADINPECIAYAKGNHHNNEISFVCSDYKTLSFTKKPDIIFSSLFCHHFSNNQLVDQLQWMHKHSALGFFINDLQRHPLAYHSIRLLTQLFSASYLVRNDAPLSVLRSFTRSDWSSIFERSGMTNFTCHWKWAFRWLITLQHA